MDDLITVYLPTHNRLELLKRAVFSVLSQTYKNLELIICDDGSSDGTSDFLKKLVEEDLRVKFITNQNPQGACFSRNRCIDLSQGKYITGLDDDDYFLENRLQTFMDLVQDKGDNIYCANLIYKSKRTEKIGESFEGWISHKELGYRNIIGNQIFISTKKLKKVGGFDLSAPAWQDYDLWFRLLKEYSFCYRTKNVTYVMDISHEAPRITTSSNAYRGYKYFLEKHKDGLNIYQKNCLCLEDKINRGEVIQLGDVLANPCFHGYSSYIKGLIKNKFPIIKRLVENEKKKLKDNTQK